MRNILLAAAAVLALGACTKKSPATGASATASATGGGAVASIGAPTRKAGLWIQTMTRDGKPTPMGAMRVCIDATTEARMSVFGRAAAGRVCARQSMSRGLDGAYHFSSTCRMGEAGTVTSNGTASGDFSSKYLVHSESDVAGSRFAPMNGHHVTEMQATWSGPCPPDMAPGDVVVGGFKMNLNTANEATGMPTAGG